MVERGANIDLIFRNGLKDFEVLPPEDVWKKIKPAAARTSKILVLFRAAALVALLISIGAVSLMLTRSLSDAIDGAAITLNQDAMPEGYYTDPARPIAMNAPEESPVEEAVETTVPDDMPAFNYKLEEISLFVPIVKNKSQLISSKSSLPDRLISSSSGNYTGDNFADEELKQVENITGEQESKWRIGAMVTPTYYSNFNLVNADGVKDMFDYEKAAVSYSGGVSFSYNVSKRISIQSGIYYASLGQKVAGVNSYSGFSNFYESKGPGDFIVRTSSGNIISNNSDIYLLDGSQTGRVMTQYTLDVFDPVKSDLDYLNNSLHQNFNYLELPIVMRYKLFDRKIDFNLIGAISYNILLANSAFTYANGIKTYVGETDGINPVTLSSAVGMGLEYSLSDRLLLNLEPTFRYYMTPMGGIGPSAIHPYSFGILSGISFKF